MNVEFASGSLVVIKDCIALLPEINKQELLNLSICAWSQCSYRYSMVPSSDPLISKLPAFVIASHTRIKSSTSTSGRSTDPNVADLQAHSVLLHTVF